MMRCLTIGVVAVTLATAGTIAGTAVPAAAATTGGPLHTTGTDTVIYDAANQPVRLAGFNWTGTEGGGRADTLKTADVCGSTWRTPADGISGLPFTYDNIYAGIKADGYNVIRLPVSWHNLEPVAPVWNEAAGRYDHTWNATYLNDLKSMVTKANANGLMVILDMHQDFWSPALHRITNWDGSQGYCEGVGTPRWLNPTMDAKTTTQQSVDYYNGMNWFFRDLADPASTINRATPWQLLYSAWDHLAYEFSAASGFADAAAVVGADLFNEPYYAYVGGRPPAGQTVLQAAGARLVTFYDAIAPAITNRNPGWLLFFQDCTGGYNAANPHARETPAMTAKPTVPGNWVYSVHIYNFGYGTFADGVTRHDDFGITVATAALRNAEAWGVPLYVGEFTNFTGGKDARTLTDADMAQTRQFLNWAKQNRVSWTFWAYVNPYRPMTVVEYTTNQAIDVVRRNLAGGLDAGGNLPPTASFTSTVSGLSVSVDGSASSDADGTVASHSWEFGDGASAAGAKPPDHTYASAGTYQVKLTVTDDDGATATSEKSVTVAAPGPLAADTFDRTVTAGWGAAEVGGTWSACGASCSVGSGVGRFVVPAGRGVFSSLTSVSSTDTDVTVDVAVDRLASGSGAFLSLVARGSAGNGYWGKMRVAANGALTLSLVRLANWAETALASTTFPAGTVKRGERVRLRVQAVGTTPTALKAKVWSATAQEPAAWDVDVTDSVAAQQQAGGVGVYGYVSGSATNGPVTVTFDNLQAGRSTTATNVDPVAAFTAATTDLRVSVDGSGSSDADGSLTAWAWNFGDGASGSGATAAHTYAAAGTYQVTLTVTDNRGGTATLTKPVTVTSPAVVARDQFDRTVTGGLGTAPVGGAWTTVSGGARLSVSSGSAIFRHPARGNQNEANLAAVASSNTDLRVAVTPDAAGTGGGTYVSIAGRRVSATTRIDARLRWLPGNRWVAALTANRGSSTLTILGGEVTVPGTFAPVTKVNVRLQVFGTSPTTVRMKAWASGTAEPTAWLLSRTESYAGLQRTGSVGMQTYLSTSATVVPITMRFSDLTVVRVP